MVTTSCLERWTLRCGLWVALLLAGRLALGDEIKHLAVGEPVSPFALRDLHGKLHDLALLKGSTKAIVLAFTGNGCPIAEQYARRLEALHRAYLGRGVRFFGINANRQDTVPELRGFVNEFELSFPLLKDHDQSVADRLGAERTTAVFVFDSQLTLRYRGRIDDQFTVTDRSVGLRKDRPEVNYLVDALEAVLGGRRVEVAETEAVGCVIGRRLEPRVADDLTFHRDVEPILQRKCQSCHRPGEIAPFSLMTYEDVAGWAGMIEEVVENRRMPPWHANPKYGEFTNDRSLSATDRDSILRWIASGAPAGDPKDAPEPVTFTPGWMIGEPDAVFEMPKSFEVPATGTVRYQYFLAKTSFPEDRWVRAMEVRPGSREAVHHILVFAVDPEDPRAWRRETGGGVSGYFAAMVPGEGPNIFGEGRGKRLPAGATLIFQVHYTTNGRVHQDRSKIGLLFARKPVSEEVKTRSVVTRRRLRVPPKADAHAISAYRRLETTLEITSFLPHMHLRGSAFRYLAHYAASCRVSKAPPFDELGSVSGANGEDLPRRISYDDATGTLTWAGELSGEAWSVLSRSYGDEKDTQELERLRSVARSEVLLDVPTYDFGWQSCYRLKTPKLLPAGTVIEGRAVYNNSPSNPALTRDMWSQEVRWGDQTWEEMLIGYFDCIEVPAEAARSF